MCSNHVHRAFCILPPKTACIAAVRDRRSSGSYRPVEGLQQHRRVVAAWKGSVDCHGSYDARIRVILFPEECVWGVKA